MRISILLALLLIPRLVAQANDAPSPQELLQSWRAYAEQSAQAHGKPMDAPMDFEAIAQLNLDAAQAWEALLQCFGNNATTAKEAYFEKNFQNCHAQRELSAQLGQLHERIRQFALTSEVKRRNDLPNTFSSRMIHPLFVQVLLEEAAKYTVHAVRDAPDKPKKIGICTGVISIGWCEDRPSEPRKKEMSREERNILESFRYLVLDNCNLGLDTQGGFMVMVGIMNGFGVQVQNGNFVVIQHGRGVFYAPKSWAADGAFVMQGSQAEHAFRLQENLQKNCGLRPSGEAVDALNQFSILANKYAR